MTAQTIGNLLGTRLILNEFVAFVDLGKLQAHLDPAVVRDRDLCAVRIRQSELGRDPDRRHRGAGAVAQESTWRGWDLKAVAAGTMANFMSACIAGMLLLIRCSRQRETTSGSALRCSRRSPSCSAAAWARSPMRSRTRLRSLTPRFRAGRDRPPSATPASWSAARSAESNVAVMAGRAHLYEGYTPARRSRSAFACSRSAAYDRWS